MTAALRTLTLFPKTLFLVATMMRVALHELFALELEVQALQLEWIRVKQSAHLIRVEAIALQHAAALIRDTGIAVQKELHSAKHVCAALSSECTRVYVEQCVTKLILHAAQSPLTS